jgi:hypothetical protein
MGRLWILALFLLSPSAQAQDSCALRGTCRTGDGKPVAGVEIILGRVDSAGALASRSVPGTYHTQALLGREVARVRTSADGTYAFEGLAKGVYHVSPAPTSKEAAHEDLAPRLVRVENEARLDFAGRKPASLWLEVKAKAGARVRLWDERNARTLVSREADASGAARLYLHERADARVFAETDDEVCTIADEFAKSPMELPLVMRRSARARLRIEVAVERAFAVVSTGAWAPVRGGVAEVDVREGSVEWTVVADGAGCVSTGRVDAKCENGGTVAKGDVAAREPVRLRVVLAHEGEELSSGVAAALLGGTRLVLRPRGSAAWPLVLPSVSPGGDGSCAFRLTEAERVGVPSPELWSVTEEPGRDVPNFENRMAAGALDLGSGRCAVELKALVEARVRRACADPADLALWLSLLAESFEGESGRGGAEEKKSFALLGRVCRLLAGEIK